MKIVFPLFSLLVSLVFSPGCLVASEVKIAKAVLNICQTAIGQAGRKAKLDKKDKAKLQTCLKSVNKEMNICLAKGKKVTLKEGGGSKKSMIKLLKAQKQTTICNLDATIKAVEKYY